MIDFDFYGNRDTCLNGSLYTFARLVDSLIVSSEYQLMTDFIDDCRLTNILGHRKNPDFRWSNAEGIREWLYDKVLKYFKVDPYCGLNSDQYRALFVLIYYDKITNIRNNVLLGFILRLGFTPTFQEHILIKPQAYVLFWKSFKGYKFNPLYWYSRLAFSLSKKRNLSTPIEIDTSNKITLLPTMYLLGDDLPYSHYICDVYNTYYKNNGYMRRAMISALEKLRLLQRLEGEKYE